MNGMEPAFGEAYGGHRGLLSPYPLAMSPQGGRTEYDQVRQQVMQRATNVTKKNLLCNLTQLNVALF